MKVKRKRKKAGHRSWAPRGGKAPGHHRGDIMSKEKRSELMSRIRGKDTGPEQTIRRELRRRRLHFRTHTSDLPGRPDIVFRGARVAVFVDGDFWHGWRFPLWQHKLSEKWREKIGANRTRDQRNFRRLRRMGWKVIRLWEHQVEADPEACCDKIEEALSLRRARRQ